MKVIALRSFRNNRGLEIKDPQHPDHVHKGAIFEIGGNAPYDKLNKPDQQLVALLNDANCIGDANDPKIVAAVNAELAQEKKTEDRAAATAAALTPKASK